MIISQTTARMTFGSLFSGIGGLDLGLERAGMECRFQVENDPYCNKVLAKHWPEVRRYGDIKTIDWKGVEHVDLICGGFPCQPVSLAGKHRGQEDERWLWPDFANCVRILRPQFVLVENVPGLLAVGMADVLCNLAALRYDVEWDCIRASDFGAPHERERIYLVAHSNKVDGQAGVGDKPDGATALFTGGSRVCADIWLQTTSRFAGVGDGLPARVYQRRVEQLGNAVVPQVAEWIGKRICDRDEADDEHGKGR